MLEFSDFNKMITYDEFNSLRCFDVYDLIDFSINSNTEKH